MAKIKLQCAGGVREVEGRRFAFYIKNVRFWFAVHASTDFFGREQITHVDSGLRVVLIEHMLLAAALGDKVGAAKSQLEKLIQQQGADKVYDVIRAAAPLAKGAAK